jgi:hypothetical protein
MSEWITGSGGSVASTTGGVGFIAYSPSEVTDAAKGVYATWAGAHAAALAITSAGGSVDMRVTEDASVPAGTYDMNRIRLMGVLGDGNEGVDLTCADGVIFQDLAQISDALKIIGNNTSAVMFTHTAPTGGSVPQLVLDRGAGLRNEGTVEMFVVDSGVDSYTSKQIICDRGGVFENGGYEPVGVYGTDSLQVVALVFSNIAADTVRGTGFFILTYDSGGGQGFNRTHTNHTGSAFEIPVSWAANTSYTPTTPADWSGSFPGNISTALDRIAAHIGPIP